MICPGCGFANPEGMKFCGECGVPRYQVKKFLGEGGRKKVYLAHDTVLDRDVAFALIKTEGLDEEGRSRITREAQAMAFIIPRGFNGDWQMTERYKNFFITVEPEQ